MPYNAAEPMENSTTVCWYRAQVQMIRLADDDSFTSREVDQKGNGLGR